MADIRRIIKVARKWLPQNHIFS